MAGILRILDRKNIRRTIRKYKTVAKPKNYNKRLQYGRIEQSFLDRRIKRKAARASRKRNR